MDILRTKEVNIRFGNGTPIKLLGTVTINTPFSPIDFHIIELNTPFLMLLKDINRLGVYLNNTTNQLVGRNGITMHIDRK